MKKECFACLLVCMLSLFGTERAIAQTDDHGNSCETGTPVDLVTLTTPTAQEILGALTPNDQDFFIIEVPSPNALVTVSTAGESDTFGRISHVVDGVPIFLAEDSLSGTGSNFLLSLPLDEGTYCVEVRGQNTGIRGPYVLQVVGDFIPAGSCSGAAVTVSVPTLAFGPVAVGALSVPQSVTISNTGSGQLFIDPSILAGSDARQYGILNDTCAARVLQPGEQCSLQGIFAPLDAGAKTALITIPCNDLDSLPLEVELSGSGVIPQ